MPNRYRQLITAHAGEKNPHGANAVTSVRGQVHFALQPVLQNIRNFDRMIAKKMAMTVTGTPQEEIDTKDNMVIMQITIVLSAEHSHIVQNARKLLKHNLEI